jgi:tetratricopeptide (TPR) repeat protein
VVHLGVQLAEALAHTHQAGVCHRDLKPSNVLLTPSGCPMLLDFNLSADVQLERQFVGGTLPYMSPEQLRSMTRDEAVEDAESDPRTDLFSLGVILYELLSGTLPFGDRPPDASPQEAAADLLARQACGCRPLHQLNPHANCGLSRLVHQCLAVDPAERPRSAHVLAAQLRGQLSSRRRLVRWAGRRRFLLGGGVLSVLLMAGIATTHLARYVPRAQRAYEAGVQAFQRGDFDAAVEHFTLACNAAPDAYQPRIGRGQALLAAGHCTAAIPDFEAASELHPQGWTFAWLGYCHDCVGANLQADRCYTLACDDYQYENAAVWNNRGYNALHRGAIQSALECLSRAVELDPQCQTAYRNRALTHARRGRSASAGSAGQLALQDMELALQTGPPHGELLLDAALLHWKLDRTAAKQDRVVRYLRQAMELGVDRARVRQVLPDLDATILAELPETPTTRAGLSDHGPRLSMPHRFPPLGTR